MEPLSALREYATNMIWPRRKHRHYFAASRVIEDDDTISYIAAAK